VVEVAPDDGGNRAVEPVLRLAALAFAVAIAIPSGGEDRPRVRVAGNLLHHGGVVGGVSATRRHKRPGLEFRLAGRLGPPPVAAVVDEDAAGHAAPGSH